MTSGTKITHHFFACASSLINEPNSLSRSKYQHVQIFDTVDNGKVLVLDGLVQLAESDMEGYTHALMNLPHVRLKSNMLHCALYLINLFSSDIDQFTSLVVVI